LGSASVQVIKSVRRCLVLTIGLMPEVLVASKTPDQRRIEQLEKDNKRLNRKLEIANDCLDLQKKALSMLDHSNNGSDV
jgi:hypothetical protein